MVVARRTGLLAILMLAAPAGLLAQWPDYKLPGVPRTPDGKANLSGPTPRMADGKPDLSGVWEYMRPPGAPPPAPPPREQTNAVRDIIPLSIRTSQFWNLGASFKDGLPFTPWAAELHRQRVAENSKDNPDAHCLPLGLMQLHMHPQPRKIIQTPGLIVILYEAQGGIRQIFTDGRPLPKAADVQPWWYGYSVGHWEDDTLVVETTGFRDDVWLDIDGSPLTESGKMTERIKRLNFGTLQTDVTIEDPKAYTKPFTVRVTHRLLPDTDLIEFICTENDRSGPHLVGK